MSRTGIRRGRLAAATLLLCVGLAVAGCGSSTDATPAAPTAAAVEQKSVTPTDVRIPKIKAQSSLIQTGLNKDGTIEVPSVDQPLQASWYKGSPVPGQTGPAVILGHVDGKSKEGIFFRLRELAAGDEVFVKNSDGTELKFVVDHKDQVPKDKFPSDTVYANTAKPELRLITCGGAFDKAAHNYVDNVIVYAKLAA